MISILIKSKIKVMVLTTIYKGKAKGTLTYESAIEVIKLNF